MIPARFHHPHESMLCNKPPSNSLIPKIETMKRGYWSVNFNRSTGVRLYFNSDFFPLRLQLTAAKHERPAVNSIYVDEIHGIRCLEITAANPSTESFILFRFTEVRQALGTRSSSCLIILNKEIVVVGARSSNATLCKREYLKPIIVEKKVVFRDEFLMGRPSIRRSPNCRRKFKLERLPDYLRDTVDWIIGQSPISAAIDEALMSYEWIRIAINIKLVGIKTSGNDVVRTFDEDDPETSLMNMNWQKLEGFLERIDATKPARHGGAIDDCVDMQFCCVSSRSLHSLHAIFMSVVTDIRMVSLARRVSFDTDEAPGCCPAKILISNLVSFATSRFSSTILRIICPHRDRLTELRCRPHFTIIPHFIHVGRRLVSFNSKETVGACFIHENSVK
ncbi:hypothetical protein DICVIV_12377 [Dictyocaulus viviparus]|uniref:Uncharacterized protein n=1 Tax=Dictyocaulus viviparus TaxID=29172 RepID=A0A0D8XH14_DICVI|nr:hypothetical protein DICVIV_12377 [Dictyocaulus viviparus]